MSLEKVVETFDHWAETGRAEGMEEGHGDVVRQVVSRLEIQPGDKILDLGCGNGWATRLLAQTAAGVQAIGVDASPKMIARADELHSFTIRARYDLGNFEQLDFGDATFDRAFSMEALYYATDLPKALSELHRILKPGGRADVIVDHYKESPATASWSEKMDLPLHYMGEADWRRAFETAGFRDVATERVIDSRGPGDQADFEGDDCVEKWEEHAATHAAGSLWIRGVKAGG